MQFELNSREKAHGRWATHAIRNLKLPTKFKAHGRHRRSKLNFSRESPLLMGDTCDRTETSPGSSKLMCYTCD